MSNEQNHQEVELKLAVAPAMGQLLPQILQQFTASSKPEQFLANRYYDSLDYFFANQKMGLRVRQQDDRFTLTLKTNGEVVSGLHSRPEYNLDVANGELNLAQLADTFNLPFLAEVRSDLTEIFSTDFTRQMWIVNYQGCEIEVAFDLGEVVAGNKRQPICEIEFELKKGALWQLLAFVSELLPHCIAPLHFNSTSKAKRGYGLLQHSAPQPKNWLDQWRAFVQNEAGQNSQQKLTALLQLEQGLVEETIAFGAEYFAQDFVRSVERIGAFFNLYHHYSEQGKLLEQVATEQLEQGKTLAQDLLLELAQSNGYLFDEVRDIIREHSETKNNQAVMARLLSLIQTTDYAQRMVNLISLTL